MSLDPQAQSLLTMLSRAGAGTSLAQTSLHEAREAARRLGKAHGEVAEIASVTDRTIPGPTGDLKVRVYRPEVDVQLPILVFFHGGGFVLGDLEINDGPCRALALKTRCIVVSVDYRLAPEHKYPAAVEDAYAAVAWVAGNPTEFGGDGRLGVAGDSAGGTLAAVTALMARDRRGPRMGLQLLIYPVTEFFSTLPSRTQNGDGYLLTAADIARFSDLYLDDPTQAGEAYCSPLLASDHSGLPPAIVVTAGYDPLHDEGAAYAKALEEAGVEVRLLANPGMIHGFWSFSGVIGHTDAVNRLIGEHIGQLFSASLSGSEVAPLHS